jgi:O-antigen ligase
MGMFALIGVIVTLSRGAIIALALLAVAMAAIGWIRTSRLAVVMTAGLFLVPLFAPFYIDRVASLTNVTYLAGGDSSSIREADGAMRGRLTEMLAAFNVFLDYPMLGVGPGQFAPYYVQDYSRDPDIEFRVFREARRAHTLYLELAAENGIVGLTSFLAIVGLIFTRLWRARKVLAARAPGLADLATACWLSILAYMTTAMFLHLSYQRYFWLLLAIATAALHVVTSEAARRRIGVPKGF